MKNALNISNNIKGFMREWSSAPDFEPQTPSGHFECDAINTCYRPSLTRPPLCMRSTEGPAELKTVCHQRPCGDTQTLPRSASGNTRPEAYTLPRFVVTVHPQQSQQRHGSCATLKDHVSGFEGAETALDSSVNIDGRGAVKVIRFMTFISVTYEWYTFSSASAVLQRGSCQLTFSIWHSP